MKTPWGVVAAVWLAAWPPWGGVPLARAPHHAATEAYAAASASRDTPASLLGLSDEELARRVETDVASLGSLSIGAPGSAELRDYALARLDRCPFQEDKPTCADCKVHCYKPDHRQHVREVMLYAGPRMLWRHPILALAHWLVDRRREPPMLAGRPTRP